MSISELYEKAGGDYDNIQGRLRSDAIIQRFLLKFLDEKSYDALLVAAESDNVEEAILSAHKLKGVAANMSFSKLCDALTALLVQLRKENQQAVDKELLSQVVFHYQTVTQLIREL